MHYFDLSTAVDYDTFDADAAHQIDAFAADYALAWS